MKLTGFTLLCAVVAPSLWAEPTPEPATQSKTSSRLAAEIRASLPKYAPPANSASSKSEVQVSSDSDVLELPKVVVRERAAPRIEANDLITTRALNKKLARDFKNSLTGLDAVLNGFSIPLVSPSLVSRGRAAYKAQRRDDLNSFLRSSGAADSKSAVELNKAVLDMDRAEDWQNR